MLAKETHIQQNLSVALHAAEEREHARERARTAAEQAAREDATKADLIRQLRARVRVPTPHTNVFDRTGTGKHGLLEEMSIVVRLLSFGS